jgi:regulator of sigma E protease
VHQAFQLPGWTPIVELMAFISVNLGIFNLLPFPILDGGMILFLIVESLLRRDVNLQVKERVYQVAFVCFVLFFVFVIFNDISRLSPFAKP